VSDGGAVLDALGAIGRADDGDIDLAGAALLLARAARPDRSAEPYRRHLEQLEGEVADYAGRDQGLARQHEALVQVIARRHGYAGTQRAFSTLDGADLMRVIDRRSGLPVTLGILYIDTARKLGWTASGIDFPGRFLVRLEADGERRIIDPFEMGEAVDAVGLRKRLKEIAGSDVELKPAYYRALSAREVLIRLQANIRVRLVAEQRWSEAAEVVERMLLVAPDNPALWREQGVLQARMDRVSAAIASLEESLRRGGPDPERYETSALIQELRQRLS
jgi:regulator of sirC expression with transglutaminase-like and TPR domain